MGIDNNDEFLGQNDNCDKLSFFHNLF